MSATLAAACADSPTGPSDRASVGDDATLPQPVVDPTPSVAPGSALAGLRFYVDPKSSAQVQVDAWSATRPFDAAQVRKIAEQPQAFWFNEWTGPIQSSVAARTTEITATGAVPVFVAYNIPLRDCGSYSGGGAASADAYRTWIRGFANGLAGRRSVVILEPDALAGMGCLSASQQDERLGLLRDAVQVLKSAGHVSVYLDGGHSAWQSAAVIAARLQAAGIAQADGFALNVSNYQTTQSSIAFGTAVSSLVGGSHFVIDTSRNGAGPTATNEWCNPAGRILGTAPTTATGHALVDAYLWVKRPGESDGTCNGGPAAGKWFSEWALDITTRTTTLLAYAG